MSQLPVTIPKSPVLKPVEDFYRLRSEGIGFIEQMGSQQWTDYNLHDPGITLLEALAYALTDLGYRTGWPIRDLLAPELPDTATHQPFFTAREILTVNPWTPDDFRRLLIDLDGVRNAWIFCKECACDLTLYAWCDREKQLQLGYQMPADIPPSKVSKVQPRGLYEVLLELESDPQLGDLNDRKIVQTFSIPVDGRLHNYTMELRFPEWELLGQAEFAAFVDSTDDPLTIVRGKFSRSRTDPNEVNDAELHQHWRNVFYLSFSLTIGGEVLEIHNVSMRLFSDNDAKRALMVSDLSDKLVEGSALGFFQQYRRKLQHADKQVEKAKESLHLHRNLDEDYCRVKRVDVEDVATCADVEVTPDADIERVQARIWFEIEQYFNPLIPFYTLSELLEAGKAVEDVFNGPAPGSDPSAPGEPPLGSGFIKVEELAAAGLRTVLRTSDLLNRLMDIEGVVAVNNLLLTKYDAEGQAMRGAADLGLDAYRPDKISAEWTLAVTHNHQPRLYLLLSQFLFYKNGLPFTPRTDEALDTLTQLRGEAERPKIKNAPQDLPVPQGQFRHPEDYFPVQYSLPLTYGVGEEGLPSQASALRHAQAKQLKAYLMPFEQQLVNALSQTANVSQLFSLDPTVSRTYHNRLIDNDLIKGASDLFNVLTQPLLNDLTETEAEFLERRNRFLDHIMARFGEQFGEYALLLNNLQGQQVALQRLIDDKIGFLKAYPIISRDRARAFHYKALPACSPETPPPGLLRRIKLLLGYPDLQFDWTVTGPVAGVYTVGFELRDGNERLWLSGSLDITAADISTVRTQAFQVITPSMVQLDAYDLVPNAGGFILKIKNADGSPLGQCPTVFVTKAGAITMRDELMAWAGQERAILVEHLLLRPKFPGDATFPICAEGTCGTCEADAYSFRLTFVMPGWNAPYDDNLDMRGFANRTIQRETPSHLLPKICWVGNNGFVVDPCDPFFMRIRALLSAKGRTGAGLRPTHEEACACAKLVYEAYSAAFINWFAGKELQHFTLSALPSLLGPYLRAVHPGTLGCQVNFTTALEDEVWAIARDYFVGIAYYGFQFEKFEAAWCAWLTANAAFDWTELRLEARVEALLAAGLDPAAAAPPKGALCHCAAKILGDYAVLFHTWMDSHLATGEPWTAFGEVPLPVIAACPDVPISNATRQKIKELLVGRKENEIAGEDPLPGLYPGWVEVSYRLWIVLDLLAKLRNTYPTATLHDCDDGSDANPVRLNLTALGSF